MKGLITGLVAALVAVGCADPVYAAAWVAEAPSVGLSAWAPDPHVWIGIGIIGVAIGGNAFTLLDFAKGLDPNGQVATVAELLAQRNEILTDMVWQEGNLPTGDRITVRTGLPAVFWRLLNQGVPSSKSTKAQIDEACGMLEAWSEVDVDLLKLNAQMGPTRLSEAMAFLEAMNQELASTLFYGNGSLSPAEFNGLSVRYSALTGAGNSQNVIDAGGSTSGPPTDLASIWLVAWGQQTVHGIFPKGSKAGLSRDDYGEVTVETTAGIAGSRMRAMQERFQWKAGISLRDWRYVVRIANIDISDEDASTAGGLIDAMEEAIEKIPDELGRPVFYANRTVRRILRKQIRKNVESGGGLTYENVGGKRVLMFSEVPVRRVDALLTTEAEVT